MNVIRVRVVVVALRAGEHYAGSHAGCVSAAGYVLGMAGDISERIRWGIPMARRDVTAAEGCGVSVAGTCPIARALGAGGGGVSSEVQALCMAGVTGRVACQLASAGWW